MPLCKNDEHCPFTNNSDHKNQYLHTCKYGDQCRSLHNTKHTEWFIHSCPFQGKCSLVNNFKHNITFKHPPQPSTTTKGIIERLIKLVFDEESGKGTLKLRCPYWDKCALTNQVEHLTQFYHPCRYGDQCRKQNDEDHCEDFFHPCKYGSKCTNYDPYHRYSVLHEDRSPELMECHKPAQVKKSSNIPSLKFKPTVNSNSNSNNNPHKINTAGQNKGGLSSWQQLFVWKSHSECSIHVSNFCYVHYWRVNFSSLLFEFPNSTNIELLRPESSWRSKPS